MSYLRLISFSSAYLLGLDDVNAVECVAGLGIALWVAFADRHQYFETFRINHLAENGVLAVQVWRWKMRNEKLATIRVCTRVCHAQDSLCIMLYLQRSVFIR